MSELNLNFNIQNLSFVRGNVKELSQIEKDKVLTQLIFVYPLESNILPLGKFEIKFEDDDAVIEVLKIDENNDPIIQNKDNINIGDASGINDTIPFEFFTDNKNIYPALLINIILPYRVANWTDASNPTGFKTNYDFCRGSDNGASAK
ncbi:hypothetical protein [Marispirochaeta aestuarii]|uniref:hypothetical protein n=1 Tax=Marispirochaeta aestuarii TaxID=1963862 RepID=UPI002ABD38A1|nr:hypothetical protein [Marispirochaeta aestuarii]